MSILSQKVRKVEKWWDKKGEAKVIKFFDKYGDRILKAGWELMENTMANGGGLKEFMAIAREKFLEFVKNKAKEESGK